MKPAYSQQNIVISNPINAGASQQIKKSFSLQAGLYGFTGL